MVIDIEHRAEEILGFTVVNMNIDELLENICGNILQGKSKESLMCLNPHSLVVAEGEHIFKESLQNADWLIPDGTGIVLASKVLGGEIRVRITGSDIFHGVNEYLNRHSQGAASCFFLGSSEKTLSKISEKMRVDFPGVQVAGTFSPPFMKEFSIKDNEEIIAAINRVKPDILWVGMTAPKQEKWIYKNRNKLDVKFVAAIGAVFDFYIGNIKRSPLLFQKFGLEWLPRLMQEPRRLFRRNFISSPIFLWWLLKERLRKD